MARVGGSGGGGKCRQLYLNNNKKISNHTHTKERNIFFNIFWLSAYDDENGKNHYVFYFKTLFHITTFNLDNC